MFDVLRRSETGPDENPARFTRRRLVRWLTILTIGTLTMVACWQDPLYP